MNNPREHGHSSEIRYTRLTNNPIIVATGRGKRPDQFKASTGPKICPFCPGNENETPPPEIYRIDNGNGQWKLRVVPNKFPTFRIEGEATGFRHEHGAASIPDAHGAHEVVIETPNHEADFSDLSVEELGLIIDACNKRMIDLYGDRKLRSIQVFKNHGTEPGASLPHPHTQIIGLPQIPPKLRTRLRETEEYWIENGKSIFVVMCEYAQAQNRVVCANQHFVCLVPYEAKFPCEMCILPAAPTANFRDAEPHFDRLADIVRQTFRRLKTVFGFMPPFNLFIEEAPPKILRNCDDFFCWRLRIMPRVTKIAGFEMSTGFYVNPTPPEESARLLREVRL